jgi:hypothetical protein
MPKSADSVRDQALAMRVAQNVKYRLGGPAVSQDGNRLGRHGPVKVVHPTDIWLSPNFAFLTTSLPVLSLSFPTLQF